MLDYHTVQWLIYFNWNLEVLKFLPNSICCIHSHVLFLLFLLDGNTKVDTVHTVFSDLIT